MKVGEGEEEGSQRGFAVVQQGVVWGIFVSICLLSELEK
jgi:hypothetical protein